MKPSAAPNPYPIIRQPAVTRLKRKAFVRVAVAVCVLAVVVVSGSESVEAQLPEPVNLLWQEYIIEPELTGPEAYWDQCWPHGGSGESECVFMQATGSDTDPLNCFTYDLGRRAGWQVIEIYIPRRNATATVTYVLESQHAVTGEVTRYKKEMRQAELYGWQWFVGQYFYASSVKITACNNSAREGMRTHKWRDRLIGVDAARIKCVEQCERGR